MKKRGRPTKLSADKCTERIVVLLPPADMRRAKRVAVSYGHRTVNGWVGAYVRGQIAALTGEAT